MKQNNLTKIAVPLVYALVFCMGGFAAAQEKEAAEESPKAEQGQTAQKKRTPPKYKEPQNPLEIADAKVAYMRDLIKWHIDGDDNIADTNVINQIYDETDAYFKTELSAEPDNRPADDLRKEAEAASQKKYPHTPESYQLALEKETEKQFRVYQKGEKVKLHYYRTRKTYVIEGVFYKVAGNIVKIGYKSIPFFDLVEEDKIHVSAEYSKKKQTEFIQKMMNDYFRRKEDLIQAQFTLLKEEQIKKNSVAGFVMYSGKWVSPIRVINGIISAEIKTNPRFKGKGANLNLDSIERIQNEIAVVDTKDRELKDKSLAKKGLAARFVGTIDAEQGFMDSVFWGFSRAEVKSLLENQGVRFVPGKEYDTASSSDRQISEVRLYYDANTLLKKIVFVYNIRKPADYQALKRFMIQKYGADDGTKEGKYSQMGDPVYWSGKYTHGALCLTQNEKSGAIESLTMTLDAVPAEKSSEPENKEAGK